MPRSAILGFLQACRDGDYEQAAAYLGLSRLNPRTRFVSFGGPSVHLAISVYILTAKLDEFLAIREDIFLQSMDIVAHSGGTIAAP